MENLVVISFQLLQNADDAANKLKELDNIGDIVIYNQVLIRKDSAGLFTILNHEGPDTIDLPVGGALIGSLLGLIGGPIGLAIGALTGLLAGTVDENNTEVFYGEILKKVKDHLQEGSYALLLDVEEISTFMIDSYMVLFSEKVFRANMEDVYDAFDDKQKEKLDEEIKEQEMELKRAGQKDKAAIEEKIRKLKAKREERKERMKIRKETARKQLQGKIKNLKTKLNSAGRNRKSWLHAHKEKLEGRLRKLDSDINTVLV